MYFSIQNVSMCFGFQNLDVNDQNLKKKTVMGQLFKVKLFFYQLPNSNYELLSFERFP